MGRWAWWIAGLGLWGLGCPSARAPSRPVREPAVHRSDPDLVMRQRLIEHGLRVAPLARELNLAFWRAASQADPQAWAQVSARELEIRKLFGDRALLADVRRALAGAPPADAILARHLRLIELHLLENQVEPALLEQLVESSGRLERASAAFRPVFQGRPVSSEDLIEILQVEPDAAAREAAWEALASRGPALREELVALVRIRNQIARQLGFSDFYQMHLVFDEIEPAWLQAIVGQLDRSTAEPFGRVRARIDASLAERFGLEPGQLRPWHFDDPFFRHAPAAGQLDLDPLFSRQRPEALVEATMRLAGLELGAVLARSDLGAREGKVAQPFSLDLDRDGDVRILASLRPTERCTATLLHEAGHAVYHLGFDPKLPWLLRTPASSAVSEAVAVLFGRLTRDPVWLERGLGVLARRLQPRLEDLRARRQADELVFVRWALVMVHFERELYRDPDQDLNRLWWRLRARYQGMESPAGRDAADWAAQAHLVVAPVYYHNYLLGRVLASQLRHRLERFGPDPLLRPEAGPWLREQVFAPGASLPWRELVNRATGEQLDPSHFLEEIGAQARDANHGGGI